MITCSSFDAMGSMSFASGAAGEGMGGKTWDVKYLYDGGCSLCTMLVDMLQRRDPNERILFVDLRDPDYDARLNQNVSFEQGIRGEAQIDAHHALVPHDLQRRLPAPGLRRRERLLLHRSSLLCGWRFLAL